MSGTPRKMQVTFEEFSAERTSITVEVEVSGDGADAISQACQKLDSSSFWVATGVVECPTTK